MKPINNYGLRGPYRHPRTSPRKAIAWCIAILLLLAFMTADWWMPGESDIQTAQATELALADAVAQAQLEARQ